MEERKIAEAQIESFCQYLIREEKSAATVEKYLRDVRAFSAFIGEKTICKEAVMAYKRYLQFKKYAVRSINSMLASLNSLLNFLGWSDCRVKALKQQNAEREANDAVILALKAGKITPAQKEWAKSYALSDPKGFGSFVEKAPQIVPMDKIELDDVKALKSDALDADTLLVCKQLGISPDDVKKYGMKED